MYILIASPEESDWKIDPEEFARLFKEAWPGVDIIWVKDPGVAFDFAMEGKHEPMYGSFHRSGDAFVIDQGAMPDRAELMVWFRSLVPPSQPLVFCDEGGGAYTDFAPGMTVDDILARFK